MPGMRYARYLSDYMYALSCTVYSEPSQVHLGYVVSVIDYNISLFLTASRSNYAIIDYTLLQSPGIWNFPLASKAY